MPLDEQTKKDLCEKILNILNSLSVSDADDVLEYAKAYMVENVSIDRE